MVEIHYCPKCVKASREHIFRKVKCTRCGGLYETMTISRSRFFIIQFLFLVLGFIFLIVAFYFLLTNPEKPYEFLGVSVISFTMWIFTLGFQLMDSKDMEFRVEQEAMRKKLEEEQKAPFRSRAEAPPKLRRLLDDEEEEEKAGLEKSGIRFLFGKKEEEPAPEVVRIRRAPSMRAAEKRPERRMPEKRTVSGSERPGIRDMSALLEAEDDD